MRCSIVRWDIAVELNITVTRELSVTATFGRSSRVDFLRRAEVDLDLLR